GIRLVVALETLGALLDAARRDDGTATPFSFPDDLFGRGWFFAGAGKGDVESLALEAIVALDRHCWGCCSPTALFAFPPDVAPAVAGEARIRLVVAFESIGTALTLLRRRTRPSTALAFTHDLFVRGLLFSNVRFVIGGARRGPATRQCGRGKRQ